MNFAIKLRKLTNNCYLPRRLSLIFIAIPFLVRVSDVGAQPGSLDLTFTAGATNVVYSVLVQPDGKILVNHVWAEYGGLVRFHTNGTRDLNFGVAVPSGAMINAVALQTDGKILITGDFLSVQGVPRPCLARLNTNGTLDASFIPQLITTNPPPPPPPNPPLTSTNSIGGIWIQEDGKILVSGFFNILASDGSTLPSVVRLNTNGSVDGSLSDMTNIVISGTVLPDGKRLVVETYLGTSTILRFNTNGTEDASFSPPSIEGWVNTLCVQDGKIIIGGNILRVNGVQSGCVARLHEDGTLDASFRSEVYESGMGVTCMVMEPTGKIVIGGGFGVPNVAFHNLARLNSDGSFDKTYAASGTGGNSSPYVYVLMQQPDGKLLVGGEFTTISGTPIPYLARITGDSDIGPGWILFDPPNYEVFESAGVATLTVRRVLGTQGEVTASYQTQNGSASTGSDYQGQSGILVFQDGETEKTITIPINDETEIEDLESFQVVLTDTSGGATLGITDTATVSIQDDDGPASVDPTFVVSPDSFDGTVQSIAVQTNGRVVVGGYFLQADRVSRKGVARLEADGSLDTTFDPGTGLSFENNSGNAKLVKLQSDGRILVAGVFNDVNGTNRNHMVRLNENGSLDLSFDIGTGATQGPNVAGILWFDLLSNGQIIVGGVFTNFNGIICNGLVRLNTNGAVDVSYNPSGAPHVLPFGLQADGKVTYVGLWVNQVSRINANGSMDNSSFASADRTIWKILSLTNGNSLIAGGFTVVSGQPRQAIARLLPNGDVDPGFTPDLSVFLDGASPPYIYLFAVQEDRKVLIAIKSYRNPAGNYLARLNTNGTLDTDFEPVRFAIPWGDNDMISALAIQPDGKILVGGMFQTVNGLPHPYLIRLRGGGNSGQRQLAIKSLGFSTNQSQLVLTVAPGKPFALQTSTNMIQWTSLSTNVSPVSTFVISDSQLMNGGQRFYRVMQLTP